MTSDNPIGGSPNRPASYSVHIGPLFTANQQACMINVFDLKSCADVTANAEDIYARLADKSMPADQTRPWPDEWIALFRRWIDEGCKP
jgi:hypothetical protein